VGAQSFGRKCSFPSLGGHNSCCLVYPFSRGRNLYNKSVLSSILKDKILYLWLYVTTYLAKCDFETIFTQDQQIHVLWVWQWGVLENLLLIELVEQDSYDRVTIMQAILDIIYSGFMLTTCCHECLAQVSHILWQQPFCHGQVTDLRLDCLRSDQHHQWVHNLGHDQHTEWSQPSLLYILSFDH
jgi:hypothetical protein